MSDLQGKRALVTGGASGIGEAAARALAAVGASVTVADLDGDGAARVAAEVCGTPWQVDLSKPEALDGLSLDVDVLVNNAGVQTVSPIEEFDPTRWRFIVDLMLVAPFQLVRAALPGMYDRGWGRVINISSVHGLRASGHKSAYVSAKHGLEGLSKAGRRASSATASCPPTCARRSWSSRSRIGRASTANSPVHRNDRSAAGCGPAGRAVMCDRQDIAAFID